MNRIKTTEEAQKLEELGCGSVEMIKDGKRVLLPVLPLIGAQWYEDDDIMEFVDEDGRGMRVVYIDDKAYKVRWCS